MRDYCETFAWWAWLAVAILFCGTWWVAVQLWKPIADDELKHSAKVWSRILLHVFGGGVLAVIAFGALYGGCGYFGHHCWKGGFCEAVWKGPPWILASSFAAAPAAILLWHWRTVHRSVDQRQKEKELDSASNAQLAQRFADGAKLLAADNAEEQVAGAHIMYATALRDSSMYSSVAIAVLCEFVRRRSPVPDDMGDVRDAPAAVESAFVLASSIARRGKRRLTLSNVNLSQIMAPGISAEPGSIFNGSCFERSFLIRTTFRQSFFVKAKCWKVRLDGADLSGSFLNRALFNKASLRGANLNGAQLFGAVFRDADLTDATFDGAFYDRHTVFPDGFPIEKHRLILSPDDGETVGLV